MVGYVYWRFPRTMSWGTIVVTSWLIMCYCVIDVAAFPSSNATNRGEDSIITRMRRQSWRLQKRQLLASADPQQEKAKSLEEAGDIIISHYICRLILSLSVKKLCDVGLGNTEILLFCISYMYQIFP